MKLLIGLTILCMLVVSGSVFAQGGFEKRCGWVNNPTPGNWDLTDRDGIWIIGAQGGAQAEGDLPEFPEDASHWKKTSGGHGYGCACLTVKVDRAEKRVLQIQNGKVLPLKQCRTDSTLKQIGR